MIDYINFRIEQDLTYYIAVPDLSKVMIIIIYTSDHSIVKIGRLLRRPFLLGRF